MLLLGGTALAIGGTALLAAAQQYYQDPCQRVYAGDPITALFSALTGPQRAQACQAYRARQAYEQQLAAQRAAADQAQREREAEQQRIEAEREAARQAREAAILQRQAEAHARAVAAAQTSAESSPDNKCAEPTTAKELLKDFNQLTFSRDVEDIYNMMSRKRSTSSTSSRCQQPARRTS